MLVIFEVLHPVVFNTGCKEHPLALELGMHLGLNPSSCTYEVVGPWACDLVYSLRLSFPICKMRIITNHISLGYCKYFMR